MIKLYLSFLLIHKIPKGIRASNEGGDDRPSWKR